MVSDVSLPDASLVAQRFQALSDETRLEIIGRLAAGERCVCELTGAMDAAQSRLSFHLKVLKNAGLVSDRRDGRWSYYSLNPEALESVAAFVDGIRADASARRESGMCCVR
jgi:ArsR family transcriptional regulator